MSNKFKVGDKVRVIEKIKEIPSHWTTENRLAEYKALVGNIFEIDFVINDSEYELKGVCFKNKPKRKARFKEEWIELATKGDIKLELATKGDIEPNELEERPKYRSLLRWNKKDDQ